MSANDYASRIKAARERLSIGQRRFGRRLERRQTQGLYQERLEAVLREIEDGQP